MLKAQDKSNLLRIKNISYLRILLK